MIIMLSAHKMWFKIILLLKVTFCSLPGPSLPLPLRPRPPTLSKPFLLPTLFARGWQPQDRRWSHHWGGLRLEQSWLPIGGSASSCPGLWREGGGTGELPRLKNICTINRLKLYKTIVLLKMCKGIPIFWILARSENLCLLQELFQKGK